MVSSKVTLHMVASLDGFVAKKDGDVSWMQSSDRFEGGRELTEQDITDFLNQIDCYVMGSKTYEHALELGWPYGEKPVIVVSNRQLELERPTVSSYSGDITTLIEEELTPKFKSIWLVGGPSLAKSFLQAGLVHEIVLTVMPVILGEGLLFFDHIGVSADLHLKDITAYQDGMVDMTYEVKR